MPLGHDNPISATLSGLLDRATQRGRDVQLRPDDRLDGQTVLITGANRGLGKAVAVELGRRGARLLLACRSGLEDIARDVQRRSGAREVRALQLDLADFQSVETLCEELAHSQTQIHVLVLNAGVVPLQARPTAQGFELMFGVNYLANVLLVRRLGELGLLETGGQGEDAPDGPKRRPRIIAVSSESHRGQGPFDAERFGEFQSYGGMGGMKVYGQTKYLLNTWAAELARKLQRDGEVQVAVHSLCPGAVNTGIAREAPPLVQPLLGWIMRRWFRPPEQAAAPVVYLCCARELEGQTGRYLHLLTEKDADPMSTDPAEGARLWQLSDTLIDRTRQRMAAADEPKPVISSKVE